uniref:Lipase (Class 3) n=1 Tax=Candidatus Kentrum sp. LFY TaxID=2126342 RepID=A0A450UHS8_9GAMM|nr:MAG: Lipase (class 3) [Candidatus Kentron sp. LFY]
MPEILAKFEKETDLVNKLLDKEIPSYRQAYSDRTAWLMACLSELAYIRFNPIFSSEDVKKNVLNKVNELIDEGRIRSLTKLIDLIGYDPEEETKNLIEELDFLRFELIDTFDRNGTQAILVSNDNFIALAFRGTEATSVRDIKADTKAKLTQCETGGGIHLGFQEAFEQVAGEIRKKLCDERCRELPLFITGHSLGGALAAVATKRLSHEGGIAACYTFGSPRVGDEKWISEIKTPIYRLVNAADSVTMLPPGDVPILVIGRIVGLLPWLGKPLKSYLSLHFGGYLHCGNMRYLKNCRHGQYEDARLLYSVSLLYRLKGFLFGTLPWTKLLSDHSIIVYRKKLAVIASNRNKC